MIPVKVKEEKINDQYGGSDEGGAQSLGGMFCWCLCCVCAAALFYMTIGQEMQRINPNDENWKIGVILACCCSCCYLCGGVPATLPIYQFLQTIPPIPPVVAGAATSATNIASAAVS